MTVTTSSGLQLTQPANGANQCSRSILCVPLLIDDHLHLRAGGVQQGFSVRGLVELPMRASSSARRCARIVFWSASLEITVE